MATNLVRDRGQNKHRVLIVLIGGVKILAANRLGLTGMFCLKQSTANSWKSPLHFPQ